MTSRASALTAALALLATLVVAPATAGWAGSCPDPGGGTLPELPDVEGEFVIAGRGWGHGVGMSQYGAQGAANLGCDHHQILTTFYPTATIERVAPTTLRISLATDTDDVTVSDPDRDITWQACDPDGCDDLTVQPAGTTWTLTPHLDRWALDDGTESTKPTLKANIDGTTARIDDGSRNLRYDHGHVELERRAMDVDTDTPRAATFVTIAAGIDEYLYGLGEVPASWPTAALQAQATAARTYALYKHRIYAGNRPGCHCDLYATTVDQNYVGYEKEAGDSNGRWTAAVDATGGDTVEAITYGGRPIAAFYSSSSGGWTMSNDDWGGSPLPYLPAIDVTAWEAASSNPYATWSASLTAEQVAAAFGMSDVDAWSTPKPRLAGGRIGDPEAGHGGVVATGPDGAEELAGTRLRSALSPWVRSNFFAVGVGRIGNVPGKPSEPTVGRTAGATRFATAAAVAAAFPDPDAVVIANGRTFPDALVAGPLAGHLDAPTLLTEKASLPDETAAALRDAAPSTIYVIGGPVVVVDQVLDAAADAADIARDQVVRLAGPDRYATARAVHDQLADLDAIAGELFVATGADFPDALVASAAAARTSGAVVLAAPDGTTPSFDDVLDDAAVQVVGGKAVNPALPDAPRLAGPDRYATAAAVADHLVESANRRVLLATGADFPDALSAAPLAAGDDTVLLLAPHAGLQGTATLSRLSGNVTEVLVVGGPNALSAQVERDAADAIGAS